MSTVVFVLPVPNLRLGVRKVRGVRLLVNVRAGLVRRNQYPALARRVANLAVRGVGLVVTLRRERWGCDTDQGDTSQGHRRGKATHADTSRKSEEWRGA